MGSASVFEPTAFGRIEAKNRIVRSATYEGTADRGNVSDSILSMHEDLARGGVGTIITGYVCVSKTDNPGKQTVTVTDESCIDGLKTWAETVHKEGTKIIAQMNHATTQIFSLAGGTVYGPSDVKDPLTGITPTPLSTDQVHELVIEFGDAAERLKRAGFDGVQIHGAHGYLISRFLSPEFNKRSDAYGGSPENNRRLAIEILDEIKSRCGSNFPVWIKLNCSDFDQHGLGVTRDIFIETCKELTGHGIDAIEVSGGTMSGQFSPSRSRKHEAYHLEYALAMLGQVDVTVILVGGLRKIDSIEKILNETPIAAVSLSRAFVREPGLVQRWMGGDRVDAQCVSCNGCFNPKGTRCFFHLTEDEQKLQKRIMKLMAPKKP